MKEVQGNFGPILTQNPQMKEVIKSVARIAPSDVNVLITGESGVGKNLLSRAIHNASTRRHDSYVAVNCMTIPDSLIESELFGHEKGAYTDARELTSEEIPAAAGRCEVRERTDQEAAASRHGADESGPRPVEERTRAALADHVRRRTKDDFRRAAATGTSSTATGKAGR